MRTVIAAALAATVALTLSGCGAATSTSAAAATDDYTNDAAKAIPYGNADAMKTRFMALVDPAAKDATALQDAMAKKGKDQAVIDAAGSLYSDVAEIPKVLANTAAYASAKSQQELPALQAAEKTYASALYALSGGKVGHLTALEAPIDKAEVAFNDALDAFAQPFMDASSTPGVVPEL